MASNPKWFSRYDSRKEKLLAQGVILPELTYINPRNIKKVVDPKSKNQLPVLTGDAIILTQSCEFQKSSLGHVHLCPVITWSEYLRRNEWNLSDDYTSEDLFNQLKANQKQSTYLLNKCNLSIFEKFKGEFLVVCLDLAFIVSPQYLKDHIQKSGKRYLLALNPPYREGMAQSYGRYFMRVGNPVDYDDFPAE